MRQISTSAFEIAQRFVGTKEVAGKMANPQILAMLKLDDEWPEDDSVPWCSAFVNYVAWLLHLPRSKSLRARSWLDVAVAIEPEDLEVGLDVVVFQRGIGRQPGPEVRKAPGHVGFYAGRQGGGILTLGGNQGDMVSLASYAGTRILGCRRLA